ncbi:hypothetical protein GCM10022243_48510 [Saccharothrix violaceirubra]|uniref:Secreted protein n=1 Tax=Saccharothrix violaceirubra TaxID=413306 RepID=A0A7W7T0K1_9PSEU|nr:hypothetical protein [Saccharothrix violaceirubra]MBB4963807.1 hypothetical protein [Saccharothrix violaceirubra]
MKPFLFLLLVLAVLALLALAVWAAHHRTGVRSRTLARYRAAVRDIEAKADLYRDIDSVLATEVRAILRTLREHT